MLSLSPLFLLAAFTLPAAVAAAQGPGDPQEVVSGPVAGTKLPACRVYAPSGEWMGQEFDLAMRAGADPVAVLFVHDLSRNTAPWLTGLDRLAAEFAWTGLQTFTVRIAADRSEAEAAVKRSSDAMKLLRPIVVSVDGVDGPGGYALHRRATLTLVLAKDGVVTGSHGFTDIGRADLPRLRALVETVTGPVPREPAALRAALLERLPLDPERLRARLVEVALLLQRLEQRHDERAQRPASDRMRAEAPAPAERVAEARPRDGKAPDDEELRALLRRAIQKAADAAELDRVFAAVDARVGDDAGLRRQAVDMFKLQLSLGYGNDDSRQRAKAWVDKHGGS